MIDQLEQTLITQAKAGNKVAFDMLMLRYQQSIARIVRRYIRDSPEISDLVQEIFIKVYQSLANFKQQSAFYTWLYRIAINTSKDYLKRLHRTPILEAETIELLPEIDRLSDKDDPELLLIGEEIAKVIIDAVNELPEELATTLILREINGLNYAQIAQQMGCPIGTVRSRLARARTAIIQRLKQH